jgi:hypothetical protein
MRFRFEALLKALCLAAALASLPLALTPPHVVAQECEFLMDDGTTRSCTFTEEYGQCIHFAYYSYESCSDPDDNWSEWMICELAFQVDLLACTLEMLGNAVRLISPF